MNGGRKKWLEEKRPLTTDAPKITPTTYQGDGAGRIAARAQGRCLRGAREKKAGALVDVRSVDEFTGKIHRAARHDRNGAARGPHSGRGEYSLVAGGE